VIEECEFGWGMYKSKRFWLMQESDGSLKEIPEPQFYNDVARIVGVQ